MILPEFEYKKPKVIKKALQLFQANRGDAVYLSGEPTLSQESSRGLRSPIVIDLKNISSLNKIELSRPG